MKYFVISDIHSHYNSMINALSKHGFDSLNEQHHLIVVGDLFDRGDQTVEVLNYLYDLSQKGKVTIILGNHDSYLLDFLNGKTERALFNIERNGFGKTLKQLSWVEPIEANFTKIHKIISNRFPFLCDWLDSFPYYLEIGDYVFVHGGIDGTDPNWKQTSTRRDFLWSREIECEPIPTKTVVAGHHRVATIRVKARDYNLVFLHSPEAFDILYKGGKILIDRFVEVSNEINVLVLNI